MLLNIINLINTSFFKMSVKPYNSYKFNKPMFKSEYSNITKSVTFIEINDPLITNQEIVIPICEPLIFKVFVNLKIQQYSYIQNLLFLQMILMNHHVSFQFHIFL